MTYRISIFIALLAILFSNCDTEKFTGYSYDAEQLAEIATLSGTVVNHFTDEAIRQPVIMAEGVTTTGNVDGQYEMEILLTDDLRQNRQAQIIAAAPNYKSDTLETILAPDQLVFDFRLEYQAPIIEAASFYELRLCQAIVFDYQSLDNVEEVTATLRRLDGNNQVVEVLELPMQLLFTTNDDRGHYQVRLEDLEPLRPSPAYGIFVEDLDGFSTSLEFVNDVLRDPDPLLFDSLSGMPIGKRVIKKQLSNTSP